MRIYFLNAWNWFTCKSCYVACCLKHFSPFVSNAPFLYPLKISENRKVLIFSGGEERVHEEKIGLAYFAASYLWDHPFSRCKQMSRAFHFRDFVYLQAQNVIFYYIESANSVVLEISRRFSKHLQSVTKITETSNAFIKSPIKKILLAWVISSLKNHARQGWPGMSKQTCNQH